MNDELFQFTLLHKAHLSNIKIVSFKHPDAFFLLLQSLIIHEEYFICRQWLVRGTQLNSKIYLMGSYIL